jgi:octaprenyl-diphosphate synthase
LKGANLIKGTDDRTALIYRPVRSQLTKVEEQLRQFCRSDVPDIESLLNYVINVGGKQIRPAITLLASNCSPGDRQASIIMAGAVELLHLATLIHDDTVDDSDFRRGRATVSSLWGKNVSVLFGDYLFATSATLVCDTNNVRVIRRFGETVMELANGQLMEYFNTFDIAQARNLYYDRIYRKTASLFCIAAEAGGILAGMTEAQIEALRTYGYNLGMAFQLVDDILDVKGNATELGKPVGTDLAHGILTLPTIMWMERYPENNPITDLFRGPNKTNKVQQVLEMLNNTEVLGDCFIVAEKYCDRAISALEILPDCESRRSLADLSAYILERNC